MTPRRFDLASQAIAALFVAFAGVVVWRSNGASKPRAREVRVAWRCDARTSGACSVVSEVERCTTCHDDASHPHRDTLVARHADLGCVACHGGDGLATDRAHAHDAISDAQSHCAACHASTDESATFAVDLAPRLSNGRRAFAAMRCGACHEASVASPIATPLDVLGARGTESEIAAALADHKTIASYDLGLDDAARASVAASLAANAQPDIESAMLHRASVPGSSAEEGRALETRLACGACHDPRGDLARIANARTPDWVAFYLANPARANPAATMPNLSLTAREAASLAQRVVTARAAETTDARRRRDGDAIIATKSCAACHAIQPARSAPSLARFGESHDRASALAKLAAHASIALGESAKNDLATYLLAQRDVRVRPDLRVETSEGAELFRALSCGACHAFDLDASTPGPSLGGEGARVRPQWLFEYLRAPRLHPVRPAFHPEWAFRDLVPADRVAVRMPTYALDESQTTSLVRFFSERDHAAFPFSAKSATALTGDALTSAIADFTHKDRGACTSCHTIGIPDVARAQQDLEKLAPPLALAHERLRPRWIEACILQPSNFAPGMPAFGTPEQAARLRDLVELLRDRTVLPPAGAEGSVPALGLGDAP